LDCSYLDVGQILTTEFRSRAGSVLGWVSSMGCAAAVNGMMADIAIKVPALTNDV
jgi:hypothetical protein